MSPLRTAAEPPSSLHAERAAVRRARGRRVRPVHRRPVLRAAPRRRRRARHQGRVARRRPVRQLAPLAPGETRHFISRNRGKHSLPLDLSIRARRARRRSRSLARADVVLTNFRPGLAAELGLDYASLGPRYPRLIVGNVTAFGPRGPDAMLAGMDLVVQARSGLMAANGRLRDGAPSRRRSARRRLHVRDDARLRHRLRALAPRATRAAAARSTCRCSWRRSAPEQPDASASAADAPGARALRDRAGRAAGARRARTPSRRACARRSASRRCRACLLPHLRDEGRGHRGGVREPGAPARVMRGGLGLDRRRHERPIADLAAQAAHYEALGARVEALIASPPTAEWKAALDAHGIPRRGRQAAVRAARRRAGAGQRDGPRPRASRRSGRSACPRPRADRRRRIRARPRTPPFGSEVRELLAGAGFSADEVEALVADGVTRESIEKK